MRKLLFIVLLFPVSVHSALFSWESPYTEATFNLYQDGVLIVEGITGQQVEYFPADAGVEHTYTVRAVLNGVESLDSLPVTYSARPEAPINLKVTAPTTINIQVQ